jgi:hypothetical protein
VAGDPPTTKWPQRCGCRGQGYDALINAIAVSAAGRPVDAPAQQPVIVSSMKDYLTHSGADPDGTFIDAAQGYH